MTGFDIGKWFDKCKFDEIQGAIVEQIKDSFGEKSLKESWQHSNQYLTLEDFLKCEWGKRKYFSLFQHMAVSCLGEKRCLELLKLWWGEKKC